jgi:arylsulfatase
MLKWRVRSSLKTQGWTLASIKFGANSGRTPVSNSRQNGA